MAQRSILISDDDPQVVAALSRLALAGGFSVIPDLRSQVVELALEHRPTLILLDIKQATDGRVLLGALRRHVALRETPVVVLTGDPHPASRAFCLALGANSYQPKPVNAGFVRLLGELAGLPSTDPDQENAA